MGAIESAFIGLAAAGVLLSADVHLDLWSDGYRKIHLIGPLFLLNVMGGLVIGVAMLVWRHWLTSLLAAGFGIATLIGFWLSVAVGLFGFKETSSGTPQLLAELAEIGCVVFGLGAASFDIAGRRVHAGSAAVVELPSTFVADDVVHSGRRSG
jgi:hypothetical protein